MSGVLNGGQALFRQSHPYATHVFTVRTLFKFSSCGYMFYTFPLYMIFFKYALENIHNLFKVFADSLGVLLNVFLLKAFNLGSQKCVTKAILSLLRLKSTAHFKIVVL